MSRYSILQWSKEKLWIFYLWLESQRHTISPILKEDFGKCTVYGFLWVNSLIHKCKVHLLNLANTPNPCFVSFGKQRVWYCVTSKEQGRAKYKKPSDGIINFGKIYLFLQFSDIWMRKELMNYNIIITYLALCSAESLLFSSAWSTSISFFFLSMLRSARIPALACVNLNLLYSFSCSSSCCLSLCRKWKRKGQTKNSQS